MIVRAVNELESVIDSMSKEKRYSIDVESVDKGYPDIKLVGVSVGWTNKDSAYIPVGHVKGSQLPTDLVLAKLKEFIEGNPNKVAVMHNAKYDMTVLDLLGGIKFSENIFDTMIASWLLDTENPHGLKPLAKRYLNYAMTELDQIAPKERHPVTNDWVYRTDLVDIETMAKYAMDDATKPLQLMDIFLPRLEAEGQLKIFAELEMPKVFILKDIEMNGVRLDVETLKKRMEEAPNTLAEIEKRMYALRPNGKPFNANSTKQLNQVLFDELKIKPIGEPGKTGMYSTAKDIMEQWAGKYPIVDAILEYRQVSKLMGTYLEGFTKRIGPDGRIRTRFNQILTTGRLSSSKPNLQNIPRPDNDKFGLREMFIAGPGKKLVGADYSQIELRVLAHISKDPTFIKAFTDNEDLHSYAAKMLFNLPEPLDEVKKLHPSERSIGKVFNFSMVYGAGVKRLAATAKVSERRAKELKDKYMNRFHGIQNYLDTMHERAERDGYVSTIIGRRRHLKDAQLRGRSERENALKASALRQSGNSPVQGSAADILFIAMRNIRNRLIREGLTEKIKMVLQVHDELLFEVDEDIAEYAANLVKSEMETAVTLRVPLVADTEIGDRWSECK